MTLKYEKIAAGHYKVFSEIGARFRSLGEVKRTQSGRYWIAIGGSAQLFRTRRAAAIELTNRGR